MSFLLEALGKADNDRRRAEVPELRTYNQKRRSSKQRALRVFLVLILLVISFMSGYFLRPHFELNMRSETSEMPVSRVDTEKPAVSGQSKMPVSSTPVPGKSSEEVVVKGFNLEVISYSDAPTVRFAMINGTLVHEGDMLNSGERLLRIEPDAVVLDRAGTQIRISM